MAANLHDGCVKCGKSGGLLFCNGCQQTLCFQHVAEHRDELQQQLENLISEENKFENDVKIRDDTHYLYNEIEKWKKDMIEQIKQIAKQAKQDLKQLINQSNDKLLKDCEELKENLRLLKESDDISEIQLNKLSNKLNSLTIEINSFQLIKSSSSVSLKVEKQENNKTFPSEEHQLDNQILSNLEQLHSKREAIHTGSILIREIDPYGHFITIEHTGLTTDKQQDMVGWTFERMIDSYRNIVYRFPNDFCLKPKSFVKILSKQASKTRYSYEKNNILIADSIQTWATATRITVNRLIDANGDEKDVVTETF